MLPAALSLFLATALVLTIDGTAAASSAAADQSAPAPAQSAARTVAPAAGDGALDLGSDAVLPRRNGRTAKVQKWNVRTLWYYETLPPKWDWSLSTAVAKWNASGGRIRLARTTLPRKAQVRISYGKIGSAAGQATVGATRNAYVRLSSRFSSMDAVNARNRVTIMNVFAHELGHVLGFQHVAARCSLMAPVINVGACNVLPPSSPGYYKCRTIDTTLVQRFIRMYGGRARYPSTAWCLIDPLPPVLNGVTFTGGTTSPVTVRWKPPASVPSGSTMVVKRWQTATCGTPPAGAATFRPSVSSGVWQDTSVTEAEDDCFQLQLLNRYGAGRAAQKRLMSRWLPATPVPVIGTPSYDAETDQFSFTATLPAGATLRARWDSANPTTCVTGPNDGTDSVFVSVVNGVGTMAAPGSLPQCVSFFAHDPDANRYSAAVHVTFNSPVPDPPVLDFASWNPADHSFLMPVTQPEGTHLVYLQDDDDPSVCPGAYTSGGEAVVQDAGQAGVVQFFTVYPDACVSFYAVNDDTGNVSDPASLIAEAPLPSEDLTVGNFYKYPSSGEFAQARVNGASTGDKAVYATLPGACPSQVPDDVHWLLQPNPWAPDPIPADRSDEFWVANRGVGTTCALFTSADWFFWSGQRNGEWLDDRHGPVVMKQFTDNAVPPPA